MAKKKITFNCYPSDKLLMKKLGKELTELGDTEANLFHKVLIDYGKLKSEKRGKK